MPVNTALRSLVLIIAIAYSLAFIKGSRIKKSGLQKYISRVAELGRITKRHSSFWVGIYGLMWVAGMEFLADLVEQLLYLIPNKRPNFQQGKRAMQLIQAMF